MQLTTRFRAAALALLVTAVSCSAESRTDVTPMQKVIEILNNMLQKGQTDKHQEQVQYAAFNQFCTDTTAEKQAAIAEGRQMIERLQADINAATTESDELSQAIHQLDTDVATYNGDIKASARVRELERTDYAAAHKDYTESIEAIGKAIQVLKTQAYNRNQVTSLLEGVISLSKVPQAARRTIEAFLSRSEEEQDPLADDLASPEAYGYEFRSGGVIEMLQKLEEKFVEERTSLEREEMNKQHAFSMLQQDLKASVSAAESTRSDKAERHGREMQASADMRGQLEDTQTTLADDEKYLTELEGNCRQKAADFEDRQKLRAEEIETIQKAIEILSSGDVQGAAERHLPSLVQKKKAVALVSLRESRDVPNQLRVAAYLNEQAKQLGSRTLAVLAMKAQEDPFSKVKKMIQDLITRLQEQASEETQHKAWCDTELSENEQVRTSRTDEIATLHTRIDEYTSNIAKNTQEIADLQNQVAELQTALTEQTEMRNSDQANNEATIADAQAAQQALTQAIEMLQTFYSEAGEATALVQGGNDKNAKHTKRSQHKQDPPAIFDAPYQGMAAESGGVIGILQVVHSDFVRLETETQAAEVTSRTDFERFSTTTQVDKAQKESTITHLQTMKTTEEQRLVELNSDLSTSQKELDAANNYYDQLKPSCLNAGQTFEERNARRQEEIQSLEEALRILNGEDMAAAA